MARVRRLSRRERVRRKAARAAREHARLKAATTAPAVDHSRLRRQPPHNRALYRVGVVTVFLGVAMSVHYTPFTQYQPLPIVELGVATALTRMFHRTVGLFIRLWPFRDDLRNGSEDRAWEALKSLSRMHFTSRVLRRLVIQDLATFIRTSRLTPTLNKEAFTLLAKLPVSSPTPVQLRGVDLRQAWVTEGDLSFVDLRGARLQGAQLANLQMRSCDLSGAALEGATLTRTNLCGANLSGAQLTHTDMIQVNLTDARCCLADFSGGDLTDALALRADLRGCSFVGADLQSADLRGANLAAADLLWANLVNARIQGVCLEGARLSGVLSDYPTAADLAAAAIYG
jgi:uncharacterized protein YjbI with pentapeptide repeats